MPPIDDALARRNAIVLAVAQALAGGNNTVIVATASILGAMLAPDKGLATLPITAMVFGMWFGTVPLGVLARCYGRRFALQIGSAFGVLSGLISYTAAMQGQFWLLILRHVLRWALRGRAHVVPFRRRRHGNRGLSPESRGLGAGGRDFRRSDWAADRHPHEGPVGAASVRRKLSWPVGLRGACSAGADVRQISAVSPRERSSRRRAAWRHRAAPRGSSSRPPAASPATR